MPVSVKRRETSELMSVVRNYADKDQWAPALDLTLQALREESAAGRRWLAQDEVNDLIEEFIAKGLILAQCPEACDDPQDIIEAVNLFRSIMRFKAVEYNDGDMAAVIKGCCQYLENGGKLC